MRDKRERSLRSFRSHGIFFFVLILFLLAQAPVAHAHKVYLFAWAEGDTIYTESYFSGKKKVKDGLIKVFDFSGNELLKGKTNEMGEFSFKIPQKTDLRIVLESSMGHGAEYIFKVNEFSDVAESSEDNMEKNRGSSASLPCGDYIDVAQIREMIEDSLDSRLKPISRRLAKLQEDRGPGFTEILGGLGYIFGIMGMVLYFRARKKGASNN
jgi:nickel transport protein